MFTKIEVAEQQLDTAIKLFFENIDHYSSYTLAAASLELTDDLCDKQQSELYLSELNRIGDPMKVRLHFRDEFKLLIKSEHLNDALRLLRKNQNFLKHADRDHDQTIEAITVEELAFVIIFSIRNFVLLEQRWTSAMSLFFCWFAAYRPHLMRTDQNDTFSRAVGKMKTYFPDIGSKKTFYHMYESLKISAAYLFPQCSPMK